MKSNLPFLHGIKNIISNASGHLWEQLVISAIQKRWAYWEQTHLLTVEIYSEHQLTPPFSLGEHFKCKWVKKPWWVTADVHAGPPSLATGTISRCLLKVAEKQSIHDRVLPLADLLHFMDLSPKELQTSHSILILIFKTSINDVQLKSCQTLPCDNLIPLVFKLRKPAISQQHSHPQYVPQQYTSHTLPCFLFFKLSRFAQHVSHTHSMLSSTTLCPVTYPFSRRPFLKQNNWIQDN